MTERDSRTAKRATSPLRGGDPRPVGRGEGRRAPSETVESARAHSWLPAEPRPASPRWGRARWSRIVLADLGACREKRFRRRLARRSRARVGWGPPKTTLFGGGASCPVMDDTTERRRALPDRLLALNDSHGRFPA